MRKRLVGVHCDMWRIHQILAIMSSVVNSKYLHEQIMEIIDAEKVSRLPLTCEVFIEYLRELIIEIIDMKMVWDIQ